MEVILIQDIAKIGKKGELKNVSDGYARNFLLPKKLVKIATPEAISEALRKKEKESQAENQKNLRQLSDSIRQKKITLRAKEKKGKLFGSIGTKEIQNALKIENITIEERSIILETPIKKVGEHKIKIRLANGIETDIILAVEGSK
jgi:large subunit ribosomal protein L9